MVQPKTPPLSIRPGDERLARIDAYAAEHKLSRHLAILLMLDDGWRSLKAKAVKPPAVYVMPRALSEQLIAKSAKPRATPKKVVNRLKGEWKAP